MFSQIIRNSIRTLLLFYAVFVSLTAQAAPVITTESADQIKDLSARLNGTLNANSVGVWFWFFQIGTTDAFGMGEVADSLDFTVDGAASGSNPVALNVKSANLLPNTTYHYRLGARQVGNLQNTIYGATRTFTTGPPATRPSIGNSQSGSLIETGHNVAVMRAAIMSGSSPAKVFIHYGLSNAYGLRAELADPVEINSEEIAEVRLTNLTPGATYHYRWLATNTEGAVTSENRTFTTPPAPLVETLAATEVTYFGAVLNGRANPRGGFTMAPSFELGANTAYGAEHRPDNVVFLSGNSTSDLRVAVANLSPNTTYHFRLRCTQDNTENKTYGQDFTFTTGPTGVLPVIESEPRAEEITGYSARVRIDRVSAGDSQATAIVEYGPTDQYGLEKIIPAIFAPLSSDNIASETLQNLLPATTYHYRFRITNASGLVYSSPKTFTTPAPPEVATLPAKNILDDTATLCGRVVANGNPCEVRIDWGTSNEYGNLARVAFSSAEPLQEWLFNFPPATTIHYRLNVTDGKNIYLGQNQSFTTLPLIPKPPVIHGIKMDVARFSAFDSRPFISWGTARVVVDSSGGTSPSTLVVEYGTTTQYGMEATTDGAFPATPGSSILVKNLSPSTTYHCRARLSSALGTIYSGNLTFTTMAAPVLLSLPAVDVTDHGAVLLTSLDPKGWFFHTEIEYGLTPDCGITARQINLTGVDGWRNGQIIGDVVNLSAITELLSPSTTYYYRLKCTTPIMDGSRVLRSAVGSFTTLPPSTPPKIIGSVTVSGIASDSAVVSLSGVESGSSAATTVFHYGLTTAYGSQATYSQVTPAFGTDNPSVALTGLAPSTLYHVRATVQNGQGQAQTQNITFTTSPPGAKPSFSGGATANVLGTDRVILYGGNVSAGGAAATIVFEYGTTNAYGSIVQLANPITAGNTSYPQTLLESLTPGTVYHARCTASNTHGSVSTPDMIFTTHPAPLTTTLPASSVTDLSAVLNASVNSNGSSYSPTFEWGLTTSYGNTRASVPGFISGTSVTALSASLSGLLPSTAYHYRIKLGTYLGSDMVFTTAAATTLPTITGNIIPFAIRPDAASLKVASSIQAGGSDAMVIFEYGLTTNYGFEATVPGSIPVGTTAASPSVSLSGLTPDTTYYGRFKVSNTQGTTYSTVIGFSTAFHVLTQPASEVADITVLANGSLNAGGGTLSNLRFQWGTTANYGNSIVATSGSVVGTGTLSVSSYLPGLLPDTLYYYRLVGYDGVNTYHTGPQMTFRTSAAATVPSAPEAVVASSLGLYTATIRANNVRSGASAATVVFEYGTTTAYGSVATYGSSIPVSTSASPQLNLSGLLSATTYHVRCRVQNTQGTSYSPDATFTTAAVPVLTANNASNVTDMTATLNGQALHPGLTLYSMRFTYGTGGSYSNSQDGIASTPGAAPGSYVLSANLPGLLPNTTYQYRVEAGSPWGENYVSAGKTFTTGPPNTPPTMSGVLAVVSVSDTKARLTPPLMWAGSSNTTVTYEYGLTTAYGSTKAGPAISLNRSSGEAVDLINLQPATTYHVRCKATNAQGVAVSNRVTFITSATPLVTTLAPTSMSDLTAIFNGTVNPRGSTVSVGYEWGESSTVLTPLDLYGSDIARFQNITGTSAQPIPSPLLGNLKPSTIYYFRIFAWDSLNTWRGNLRSFTTPAASTPPSLNGTLTVSSVTMRTAAATFKNPTLQGAIFAGGSAATVSLQYGPTTAYGSTVTTLTSSSSVAAGASLGGVIGRMLNLQGGTLYHVRLKVSSSFGTVYSDDVTFTTLTDPILVTGGVSSPGVYTATLTADVTAGPGANVLVYFDWGLTESYGNSSAGTYGYSVITVPASSTRLVSLPISGLLPDRTYHYRVKAYGYEDPTNGSTVWYYGANRSFSTIAASTPPGITTVPMVSNIKSATAIVGQIYYTGSAATTVTLEYGPTTSYGSQTALAINSTPNATASGSATLTGLLPSTTYLVRAKAVNVHGTAYGEATTFTTVTPPVLALTPANGITSSSATLNGTLVSGNSSVFSYRFEWGTTTAYGSTVNATWNGNNLSATISGLVPSATYRYRLVATDGTTTVVTDNGSLVSGSPPAPPLLGESCSAYSITATAATLWINSVSAPATVVFDYGLTTNYGAVAVYLLTTSPDGTLRNATVELANLLPGATYHYRCRATNSQGTTLGNDRIFRTLELPGLLTQAPGALADKSLILQGEINARDGLLAPSFDLGTTNAYGQVVAIPEGMVSGTSPEPVSAPLAGLLPETTYHFRLKARDPRGGQYFGQSMTIKTLSVVEAWRFKYFQTTGNTGDSADSASPSGDGISNLIKYALDMDPLKPAALPNMVGIRQDGGRRLGFSFVRDAEKRELAYLVEAANSPAGPWQPLAVSIGGQPTVGPGFVEESDAGGSKKNVIVQDTIEMSQAPARFIRLRVTREGEVKILSPAQTWRLRYFGVTDSTGTAADNANPSGDGIPNLMKYALDLDPLKPAVLPAMLNVRPTEPGRRLGFSFLRDPAKRDITYLVEAADNPAGPWQPLAISTGGTQATGIAVVHESDDAEGKRKVLVEDIVEMSVAPARFMRLGVKRYTP